MTAEGVTGERPARRQRRFDPDRKERIVEAALEVIATRGVVGTSHRSVAAAADVPLGSLTYHFTGLDDLLEQAFRRHATGMVERYREYFDGVDTRTGLVDALTELICGNGKADRHDWVITYELYLAALREPALRAITDDWMAASRTVLRRFLDADSAAGVDALVEGLIMHRTLSAHPAPRAKVRVQVDRLVGDPARLRSR